MNKIFLTALFCLMIVVILPQVAMAEDSTRSGNFSNIRSKIQEQLKDVKNIKNTITEERNVIRSETKDQIQNRIRQSVIARWENHQKVITRAGNILDKLQVRIDRAKTAGKDTTQMTTLMTDARSKLADANSKLVEIASKKDATLDKAGYQLITQDFMAINKDLRIISQDAAKIIRILKGFNRSGEATNSASADR